MYHVSEWGSSGAGDHCACRARAYSLSHLEAEQRPIMHANELPHQSR